MLSMEGGADFVKTSTGKVGKGATPSATLVMLEAVRDYVGRTGRVVGMKAAGGVRTSKQAIHQLVLVNETLGHEWLTPDRFRIGASSLLNDLLDAVRARGRPAATSGPRTSRRSERWPPRTPRTALAWEYSPAPEATDHLRLARPLRAVRRTAPGGRPRPAATSRRSTRRPRSRWPRSPRRATPTWTPPSPPRAPPCPRWQQLPALERGKYVFRIARLIQERARELAIVESLDGGKPIRESRDVDIPLAAAHFFYYAGWADKLALRPRRPRASSRWASSARSCRGTSRC